MKHPVLKSALSALLCVAASGCKDDGPGAPPAGEPGEPGELGGECLPDSTCNGDLLVCVDGICEAVITTSLVIDSQDARSCEVLLHEKGGAQVVGVQYGEGSKGVHVREAPRVSLSFTALQDSPVANSGVSIRQRDIEDAALEVGTVNCFGADGAAIKGVKAALED